MASGIPVDVLDMWGHTPLHYASVCGHKNVVVSLIQNGAAVSRCNDMGHTPLDYASSEEVAVREQISLQFACFCSCQNNPTTTLLLDDYEALLFEDGSKR